ncbi:type II secretion system protein D [alpha proteobacterium Q-1]|nr:type II secretion system protein D [alpha proteobacterium Q-1]
MRHNIVCTASIERSYRSPARAFHRLVPFCLLILLAACGQDLVRGSHSNDRASPPPGLFEESEQQRSTREAYETTRIDSSDPQRDPNSLPPTEAEIYRGSGQFTNDAQNDRGQPAKDAGFAEVREREGTYSLNFANADIRKVVDAVLGEALSLPYMIDSAVSGTITARSARALPAEQVIPALEDILAINRVALVERSGVYHVVPIEATTGNAPLLSGRESVRDGFGIHIIPLQYVSADEMQVSLEPFLAPGRGLQADNARNLLLFRGPSVEANDIVALVETFDVNWLQGMSFAILPLQHADVGDVISEMEAIFAKGSEEQPGPTDGVIRLLPIERMNAVLAISRQAQYLVSAKQWAERLDRGGGTDGQRMLYVYHLKNARASEIGEVLGELFDVRTVGEGAGQSGGGLAPGRQSGGLSGTSGSGNTASSDDGSGAAGSGRGGVSGNNGGALSAAARTSTGGGGRASGAGGNSGSAFSSENGDGPRLIADDRNDAMLILATAQEFRMIESTIKRLDVSPLQVLIEATIAEVTLNDALNFGVRWFFDAGNENTQNVSFSDVSNGAVAPTFPGFSYFFESNSARAALNALSEITDVTVVSSPQLMVLDNKTARLQVGDQVPVPVQQSVSTQDPDAPIVNSIQFQDTGVILEVTPHVNASGLVVLDVLQEVSDVVPTTSSGIDAPTIQQRTISSSVAVQTGETIALGGLIRDRSTSNDTGVPILMNIPFFGNLFKSKTLGNERTELLVMLTPRVVRDQAEAREVTQELRRRMKGLERLKENFGLPKSEPDDMKSEQAGPN